MTEQPATPSPDEPDEQTPDPEPAAPPAEDNDDSPDTHVGGLSTSDIDLDHLTVEDDEDGGDTQDGDPA